MDLERSNGLWGKINLGDSIWILLTVRGQIYQGVDVRFMVTFMLLETVMST